MNAKKYLTMFLLPLLFLFSCDNMSLEDLKDKIEDTVEESQEPETAETLYGEISLSYHDGTEDVTIYQGSSKSPFANTPLNQTEQVIFTITNIGKGILNLGSVPIELSENDDDCYEISADPVTTILAEGESTNFTLSFTNKSNEGQSVTVTLYSNDPDEEALQFQISDNALPALSLSIEGTAIQNGASTEAFEGLLSSKERTITITLRNSGSADLNFPTDPVTFTGTDSDLFALSSAPPSQVLAPEEETTLEIMLSPMGKTGDLTAEANFYTEGVSLPLFTLLCPCYSTEFTLSPFSGEITDTETVLDWNDIERADRYQLQIATDTSFVSGYIVLDDTLEQSDTIIPELPNNSSLFWRVRWSGNDYGWSDWTTAAEITTNFDYYVTYHNTDAASGTVPVDSSAYKAGTSATILGNPGNLTREGFALRGWMDAEGREFSEGTAVTIDSHLDLYPIWKQQITISFYGNGATSGDTADITGYEGDKISLPACGYSKIDTNPYYTTVYICIGWTLDLSQVAYQEGEEFVLGSSDIALFPLWMSLIQETSDGQYMIAEDEKNTLKITAYNPYLSSPETLNIPSEFSGHPVTSLEGDFSLSNSTTTIIIPDSVKRVGEMNLQTSELITIDFGDTEDLADEAFKNSTQLEYITGNIDHIGTSAFEGCTSLNGSGGIYLNVETVGDRAFYGCTSLEDMELTGHTDSIGTRAFEGCTSLSGIFFWNGVGTIGDYAFFSTENLSYVCFHNSMDYDFSTHNFWGTWPAENCTSIGTGAFGDNFSLAYITLPESIEYIGDSAFANYDLRARFLGSTLPEIEGSPFTYLPDYPYEQLRIEVPSMESYLYAEDSDWMQYSRFIYTY